MDWQSLACLAFGLWLGSIIVLLFVRRFAADAPQVQVTKRAPSQSESVHWVPTKQAGRLQRVLRERGFYVLNVGSTNGVTALMICETT